MRIFIQLIVIRSLHLPDVFHKSPFFSHYVTLVCDDDRCSSVGALFQWLLLFGIHYLLKITPIP